MKTTYFPTDNISRKRDFYIWYNPQRWKGKSRGAVPEVLLIFSCAVLAASLSRTNSKYLTFMIVSTLQKSQKLHGATLDEWGEWAQTVRFLQAWVPFGWHTAKAFTVLFIKFCKDTQDKGLWEWFQKMGTMMFKIRGSILRKINSNVSFIIINI